MEIFKYKYDELFNPILTALHRLGGSGTNAEIEEQVINILGLSDAEAEVIRRGNTTMLYYRCGWARHYLKRYGAIENSTRGVWALTSKGREVGEVNKEDVKRTVRDQHSIERASQSAAPDSDPADIEPVELTWEDELVDTLKTMDPSGFERLSQRLLRELRFTGVEVIGKVGDGGIDGVGAIKVGGVLSFKVVFQCKRYSGSVSSGVIRDFRGAMIGRADKGLLITTGTFTRDAKSEAQRDGAPPIDLVDGNELAHLLKKLGLGVEVEMVEKVRIKKEWFDGI